MEIRRDIAHGHSVLLVAGKRLFSFNGYNGWNERAVGQLQRFLDRSYFFFIIVKDDGKD